MGSIQFADDGRVGKNAFVIPEQGFDEGLETGVLLLKAFQPVPVAYKLYFRWYKYRFIDRTITLRL